MYSKYSGAGNDFVVIDGRPLSVTELEELRHPEKIHGLCEKEGTDGLMILLPARVEGTDFAMEYFNSDGSGGMMCGNGGRCIAAFAASLGITPESGRFRFSAPDGIHEAELLPDGNVRLKMNNAAPAIEVTDPEGGLFLNTGTRHLVLPVGDVETIDVEHRGRELRHLREFSPDGVNVNFVSRNPDGSLSIRTYEKGVEAETLACGTGAVAAALASGLPSPVTVRARGGNLTVEYKETATGFTDIYLSGPAEKMCL